jgi:predicted phage terminase large subunit-like protein
VALDAQTIEGFVNACLKKNFDNPSEIPDCHREWWDMCCSKHKFVAIAAPRGHAKSTAITLAYTLASVLFRERRFVVLVSDTEAQSSFFLGNIKKEFEANEDIKKLFGIVGLQKDTETDCIVEFDDGYTARIIAKGSEQKLRGINWDNKRPDLIVIDDAENDEIVMNQDRREKFRRWFNGALLPCRSRDGVIRFVGTILHMDSMLERLMPRDYDKTAIRTELKIMTTMRSNWYGAKYKAHNPDFSSVLWPEYKDEAWLRHEKANYVSQGHGEIYSQEYLNIPIDESNLYFRRSDFGVMRDDDFKKAKNYYLSCDLAMSTKSRSDFSVFVVGGVDEDGRLNIVELIRQRMDSLEIIDQIMDLNKKYDPDFCVFEKGTITNSILPMLNVRMIEHNNYVSIHTINPAVDKVTRAQSIRARMRAGQVKFDKEADWFEQLEQECMRFPKDIHDDQVDALSLLGQALDKFVEAPTQKELADEEYENEKQEGGFFEVGRNLVTGY